MPIQSFVADKDLGYAQAAANTINTAVNVATFFPGGIIPLGTETLLMIPEAQSIRWRSDGTDPTATVGYPLAAGAELRYTMGQLPKLKVISQVAGAILNIYALGRSGNAS
jgi:hypothetical protein